MILLHRSLLILGLVPWLVHSLASTDSISDADPAQSGYLPNHNMDPSIVDSSIFGILWQDTFLSKEKWYAKPLVYTPNGGKQMVFIASEQNWIRTLDAVTGTVINQRQVQLPFLQSDIGCTDIPDYIGITGTPVIDPATDTVYFFSKGYKDGGAFGVPNGIYKYGALDAGCLQCVSWKLMSLKILCRRYQGPD
jgi:iron transport multicopper oxidase